MAPKRTSKPKVPKPTNPEGGRAPKAEPAEPASAPDPAAWSGVMTPPASGVKIRMYRQGHGDCFLLAFRRDDGKPFYMLIDCGMKKGSKLQCDITEVAENIRDATGGHLNLVAITHEHEDHVSGFKSEHAVFDGLTIDKLWLAWTEDLDNELADRLRTRYKDTLLGLVAAAGQLEGLGARDRSDTRVHRIIDSLLGFELSDEDRGLAATDPAKIKGRTNKEGILVVKRRADEREGTVYLRPHTKPLTVPGVHGVRFFVLGPPENEASLKDMDPQGEEFHFATAEERFFLAAFASSPPTVQEAHQPFESRYRIPVAKAADHEHRAFFKEFYGLGNPPAAGDDDRSWRRIDGDWLRSSEQFAIRMSSYINNTSLVMAIELPRTKKVLLFVGDAQRGNWVSWHKQEWDSRSGLANGEEVTVTDLMGRTVFYKVGHHGSHNATMNKGGLQDMAQGEFAGQFVAMIPANEQWALTTNDPPWRHPLDAIYKAILKKAKGRVFVMDRKLKPPAAQVLSGAEWQAFLANSTQNDLFYEFTVED